jgi:biotin-(acetyl-CoA carboxylase) ligase
MENKERNTKKTLNKKSEVRKIMESVIKMTETIEQELAAKKFLEENTSSKFIGLTNKKNLVFETKKGQVKISPEGFLL